SDPRSEDFKSALLLFFPDLVFNRTFYTRFDTDGSVIGGVGHRWTGGGVNDAMRLGPIPFALPLAARGTTADMGDAAADSLRAGGRAVQDRAQGDELRERRDAKRGCRGRRLFGRRSDRRRDWRRDLVLRRPVRRSAVRHARGAQAPYEAARRCAAAGGHQDQV